jgi:protoporphyrinogen oxidase
MLLSIQAQEQTYDVIIIGAGLSGLSAAHYLNSDNILLLEKNEEVGGRIIEGQWNNFHYPKGTEYIGEPDGILKELINELKLSIIPVPPPTDGIGYKGKIYTKDKILDFLPDKDAKKQFKELERKLAKLDYQTEDIIWENEHIGEYVRYDNISVQEWLDSLNIHPLIQTYINIENLGLFSANNAELSILYNANEMAYNLPSPKDYDESEVFTFPMGMIELSNALLKENKAKIQCNTEVISIKKEEGGICKVVANVCGTEQVFNARNVICSTPAPIAKVLLKDCVSDKVLANLGKIDYGQYITINLFTGKRFLEEAWTVSCLDNYFTSIYDVTRTQTEPGYKQKSIISAYIPSTSAKDKTFIYQTDDEVLTKTLKDMELYFPDISESVIGYDVQRFKYAYPVFGKGYYQLLQKLKADESLNTSVFLAGDYMTYAVVDGAILSGFDAAVKINQQLTK